MSKAIRPLETISIFQGIRVDLETTSDVKSRVSFTSSIAGETFWRAFSIFGYFI